MKWSSKLGAQQQPDAGGPVHRGFSAITNTKICVPKPRLQQNDPETCLSIELQRQPLVRAGALQANGAIHGPRIHSRGRGTQDSRRVGVPTRVLRAKERAETCGTNQVPRGPTPAPRGRSARSLSWRASIETRMPKGGSHSGPPDTPGRRAAPPRSTERAGQIRSSRWRRDALKVGSVGVPFEAQAQRLPRRSRSGEMRRARSRCGEVP